VCDTEYIEWKCPWCQGSKPRTSGSGVVRKAEEFGRAFSRYPIVTSSGTNPVALLPGGNHLVLSTPGVEPRGRYSAMIFLDMERRLLRTTLRATEELRLHVMRTLTMLNPGGNVYLSLPPTDNFLQSIFRANPFLAAVREIEERDSVKLPPNSFSVLISGLEVEAAIKVLSQISDVSILGPLIRKGKKTYLIKAPRANQSEIVSSLKQINKIQSMRKEPLLSYELEPYSLN
jgi:primosomal protein N' (replication factor Y)